MKILIAGSRDWEDEGRVWAAIRSRWHWWASTANLLGGVPTGPAADRVEPFTIIEGEAPGADRMARRWRSEMVRLDPTLAELVVVKPFEAKWGECEPDYTPAGTAPCTPAHRKTRSNGTSYCPTAGYRRNQRMIDERPDWAGFFRRGASSGTKDCIQRALDAQIPFSVFVA